MLNPRYVAGIVTEDGINTETPGCVDNGNGDCRVGDGYVIITWEKPGDNGVVE